MNDLEPINIDYINSIESKEVRWELRQAHIRNMRKQRKQDINEKLSMENKIWRLKHNLFLPKQKRLFEYDGFRINLQTQINKTKQTYTTYIICFEMKNKEVEDD